MSRAPLPPHIHRRYWHRSILIPLWTQQLLLQLLGAVLFWYATILLWDSGRHGARPGPLPGDGRTRALLAAFAVMYAALVVSTLFEVALWIASRLTPRLYLWSQFGKTMLSAGVWGVFVWYPNVIRDPVASRREVTICMSAVFAWLQVPMLSSLIHALLVWCEERRIKKELRQEAALARAAAPATSQISRTSRPSEAEPLLGGDGRRVIGYDATAGAGGLV